LGHHPRRVDLAQLPRRVLREPDVPVRPGGGPQGLRVGRDRVLRHPAAGHPPALQPRDGRTGLRTGGTSPAAGLRTERCPEHRKPRFLKVTCGVTTSNERPPPRVAGALPRTSDLLCEDPSPSDPMGSGTDTAPLARWPPPRALPPPGPGCSPGFHAYG